MYFTVTDANFMILRQDKWITIIRINMKLLTLMIKVRTNDFLNRNCKDFVLSKNRDPLVYLYIYIKNDSFK